MEVEEAQWMAWGLAHRLEVSRMLALDGPDTDVEFKALGESHAPTKLDLAHINPPDQPRSTRLQDRREATADLPPEVPDPRQESSGAGVSRSWSFLEQEPPGAGSSRVWNVQRLELPDSTRRPSLSQSEDWGLDTTDARPEAALMLAINGPDTQVKSKDLGQYQYPAPFPLPVRGLGARYHRRQA